MSTRNVKIGGIYGLTPKRKESSFSTIVRICRQTNQKSNESKILLQDFNTGDIFEYEGCEIIYSSPSDIEIQDLWQNFDVEYLGSDMKILFMFAYQNIADRL